MERGLGFNCCECGEPWYLHEETIFCADASGGALLPYCPLCRPPDDYKEMEDDEVTTWEWEMCDHCWNEIDQRQKDILKKGVKKCQE